MKVIVALRPDGDVSLQIVSDNVLQGYIEMTANEAATLAEELHDLTAYASARDIVAARNRPAADKNPVYDKRLLCLLCNSPLVNLWSGVKCSNKSCDYWFCY